MTERVAERSAPMNPAATVPVRMMRTYHVVAGIGPRSAACTTPAQIPLTNHATVGSVVPVPLYTPIGREPQPHHVEVEVGTVPHA